MWALAWKWHANRSRLTFGSAKVDLPSHAPLALLNLHDRRALEESLASMDAEALAAALFAGRVDPARRDRGDG